MTQEQERISLLIARFMDLPQLADFFDFSDNPNNRDYKLIHHAKYHLSEEWLFKVWRKYRDYPRNRMLHIDEQKHMSNLRRVEYSILNESIEKAFYELSKGIEFLISIQTN